MGLTAASYFSRRQVGGWVELWRISVQWSLRLISLSNYVFVLEISQISGIVQNVSVLIMVVMRIVAAVEEKKRKGEGAKGCHWTRRLSNGLNLFIIYKYLDKGDAACRFIPQIQWEHFTFAGETPCSLPVLGLLLFLEDQKKGLLWFTVMCQLQECHSILDVDVTHADNFWFLERCNRIIFPRALYSAVLLKLVAPLDTVLPKTC